MNYELKKDESFIFQNPHNEYENLILKKINGQDYLCLTSFTVNNLYKKIYIAKCVKDTSFYKEKFIQYLEEKKHFNELILSGEKKLNNEGQEGIFKIDIEKNNHELMILLKKNNEFLGCRSVEFSPFETYLKTGIFTVCGSSDIFESEYKNKGYGKALYNLVDNIIPYQQIPHGYAGAPFSTSFDAKKFWEKRNVVRTLPPIIPEQDMDFKKMSEPFYYKNILQKHNCFLSDSKYYIYFLSQIPETVILEKDNLIVLDDGNNTFSFDGNHNEINKKSWRESIEIEEREKEYNDDTLLLKKEGLQEIKRQIENWFDFIPEDNLTNILEEKRTANFKI